MSPTNNCTKIGYEKYVSIEDEDILYKRIHEAKPN